MTENISYKRCVCDLCGKEANLNPEYDLPTLWQRISITGYGGGFEICGKCSEKLYNFLLDVANGRKSL